MTPTNNLSTLRAHGFSAVWRFGEPSAPIEVTHAQPFASYEADGVTLRKAAVLRNGHYVLRLPARENGRVGARLTRKIGFLERL